MIARVRACWSAFWARRPVNLDVATWQPSPGVPDIDQTAAEYERFVICCGLAYRLRLEDQGYEPDYVQAEVDRFVAHNLERRVMAS